MHGQIYDSSQLDRLKVRKSEQKQHKPIFSQKSTFPFLSLQSTTLHILLIIAVIIINGHSIYLLLVSMYSLLFLTIYIYGSLVLSFLTLVTFMYTSLRELDEANINSSQKLMLVGLEPVTLACESHTLPLRYEQKLFLITNVYLIEFTEQVESTRKQRTHRRNAM